MVIVATHDRRLLEVSDKIYFIKDAKIHEVGIEEAHLESNSSFSAE
jgi:ABC-type lipoprotein export system ATPase subunit